MAELGNLLSLAEKHIRANRLAQAELILKRCYDLAPTDPAVTGRLFSLYQSNLDALRKSPYVDYPLYVSLETRTICNASCSFCPYPGLDRIGTEMSDDLVDKVIRELADIPRHVEFRIAPFKVSDPFTEPRLFPIIEKINRQLPNASIDLYSNGASLTPGKLEQLKQIKNFQFLNISLNEHRPEVYEKLMGLKFDRTVARLEMLHTELVAQRLPFGVVVSKVCDYETDEQFREWVRTHFPRFTVHTHRRSDWVGQVDLDSQQVPDIGCAMWFGLSIMSTGVAALCCMDGKGEHPIGDVSRQHILEVYNSPAFRVARLNQTSRLTAGQPCSQCTFF